MCGAALWSTWRQIALHPAIPEIRNQCDTSTFAHIDGVAQRVHEGNIGSHCRLYRKAHPHCLA